LSFIFSFVHQVSFTRYTNDDLWWLGVKRMLRPPDLDAAMRRPTDFARKSVDRRRWLSSSSVVLRHETGCKQPT
jgi:hypothetical protein